MYFLLGLIIGILLGGILIFFLLKKQKSPLHQKAFIHLEAEKDFLKKGNEALQLENEKLKEKELSLTTEKTRLKTECETKERELEHKKQTLEETSQKLRLEFESMAQKIFKETTKTYQDSSEKSIESIIKPLKENITVFQKSIESFEGREKFLQETISGFKEINQDMRDKTLNLTQSLQGNTATQGQWGEILLENILEKSGLRKGEEFIVQSEGLDLKNELGERLRPDVIVKLPDQKHIVIDSKVSLTHYQNYESETDKDKKEDYKNKVTASLAQHINSLSKKDYCSSEGLKTTNFVLMFIPSEPVFSFAIQDKQGLFEKAWEKSIVIVSPVTLYATLRTIASIWKIEKQNKNAERIAKESGQLYDKFVGFLEDMTKIKKGIETANNSYDSAIKKLESGQGNLIQKIENIKNLGAKTNKELPAQFHQD